MQTDQHNWTRFILRIPVKSEKKLLFEAWATPAGLESWFLRKAEFTNQNGMVNKNDYLKKGDQYYWEKLRTKAFW